MPSPSPSSLAASSASSANSYGHAVHTPPAFSTHAPPPPATCDDLDNKVAEFKRQWTSKGLGAGPDAMLHVQEYATFLPRPWGFKDRSSGSGRPSSNNDWTMPRTPPRTVSGYAAGYGPLLPPTRNATSRARQSLPTPPLEKVRGALEMMIKLPAPMSPTIPAWPVSARPVTGGKQPGKMPTAPSDLLGDDASDSDDDSDRSSSAVESESMVLSEADASPRYKAIGRKTAKRASTKGRTAGKRPTKSFAEKSIRSQTACSSEFCKLLTSEQIKALPRKSGGQLSLSPVMIRINIPSFLLPAPRPVIEDPAKVTEVKTRTRSPIPVAPPSERNKSSSKRLASDDEREPHRQFKATKRRSTPMSDSDTDRSIRKPEGGSVKEPKSKSRDGHSRSRRRSRDDDSHRAGQWGEREDRDKSGKHRARDRSRNRSRSRSRSPSRSSRGRYEREERLSSTKTRQPELDRERSDKPSLKRRDRSRSKDKERDLSRDRIRDLKKVRSRSRSRSRDRERTGDRRQSDKRSRDSAPASFTSRTKLESKDGGRLQESQASKKDSDRRKSSSVQASSSAFDHASRRDSQSATRAGSSSPRRSSSKSRPQQDSLPKASSAGSLENTNPGPASGNKLYREEYQRKRLGTDMDTPKLTAASPALVASSPLPAGKAGHPLDENVRKSSAREASTNKDTKYFREYRKYHTLAVNLKRKADEINRVQNNARLSAIVYFLSSNAFIRAFHLNDRHLAHLHPTRPDLAQEEAMKCWESMKQFSRSLSAQCRDNIQALSGLSYLLEALVYFKCHMYSNYRLRKEMQALDQFKKTPHQQPSSSSNENTMVTISADLGFRVLQNAEDWANLQRKLDDCKAVLTPDFAREQFPDTFNKWCIHPEDIGRAGTDTGADITTKFSMTVEQLQKVVSGVGADGTVVYENRIRTFPRIQWPLGTHMQLGDLMDFAEEALREYQTRNGFEYEVVSPNA
ncbi:hypothetical protein BGZ75_000498 [Mortierella antarctica]|nr:hypothetical protein BGZ75_000498 [Mortierella antarctica]